MYNEMAMLNALEPSFRGQYWVIFFIFDTIECLGSVLGSFLLGGLGGHVDEFGSPGGCKFMTKVNSRGGSSMACCCVFAATSVSFSTKADFLRPNGVPMC